ncbi:hypothetical protein [Nocardia thraciensis]
MTIPQTRRLLIGTYAPTHISTVAPKPVAPKPVAPPIAATKGAHRPPCADGPDDWDLDVGTPESWRTAVRTCNSCPLFTSCRQLAETLIERGDGPRAMIWAGVAYDSAGRIVENLDRHRATPADHKRPLRIIRTGTRPVCAESAAPTPRRRIVLGHRLRPAAAGGQ